MKLTTQCNSCGHHDLGGYLKQGDDGELVIVVDRCEGCNRRATEFHLSNETLLRETDKRAICQALREIIKYAETGEWAIEAVLDELHHVVRTWEPKS